MDLKKLELMMLLNKYNSYKVELDFKNQKLEYINGLFMTEVSSSISMQSETVEQGDRINNDVNNGDGVDEEPLNSANDEQVNNEQSDNEHEDTVNNDINNASDKDDLPKDIKLVYRKLVMITHPDKIKSDDPLKNEKIQVYLDIQKSDSLNAKIINILYYANKYSIDIEVENDYSQLIDYHLKTIELKLKNIEYSTSWVWYHTTNKQLKTIMIERLRESLMKQKYNRS